VVKVLLGAVVALGVSAGAAALAFRTDAADAPAPARPLVTNLATTPPEPAPDRDEPKSDQPASGAPSPVPEVARSPRRKAPAPSLAAELAAVRAAEAAVNRGSPSEALSILDASATSRPNLREEREALRTLAECARAGAPRTELVKRFMTAFPASLYAPRVRAACAR
jgi:hypothetical protein